MELLIRWLNGHTQKELELAARHVCKLAVRGYTPKARLVEMIALHWAD